LTGAKHLAFSFLGFIRVDTLPFSPYNMDLDVIPVRSPTFLTVLLALHGGHRRDPSKLNMSFIFKG
jgi:hypothetical protein